MSIEVDHAALKAAAGQLDEAAKWVEAAVEKHTRALAVVEDALLTSITVFATVPLSRQLVDVGADLMPALQGMAQRLEKVAENFRKLDEGEPVPPKHVSGSRAVVI